VFIEKPLSDTLDRVDELVAETRKLGRVVQLGFNLRFHPGLTMMRQLVEAGTIGNVLWGRAEFGQYLPDWRPWQDYRISYTAHRHLGGGIILDGSHELDYVMWLMGEPTEVMCMASKVSALDVDVEDCVTILLRFATGAVADVHLDFVQRAYSRSCKLVADRGTAVWDSQRHQVDVYRAEEKRWDARPYAFESNDMYVEEIRHFLGCVENGSQPLVGLEDGIRVLKVALAAASAAARGSVEKPL
jgi:predicted dehydrogenase